MPSKTDWAVIDIETGANAQWLDNAEFLAAERERIEPDGRLKDPLKIVADVDAKLAKFKNNLALTPAYGVCRVIVLKWQDGEMIEWADSNEGNMLRSFATYLADENIRLCGFNLREFDLPFLHVRLAMHQAPAMFLPAIKDFDRVLELRDVLTSGPLSTWMRAFGLGEKDVDGQAIAELPLAEALAHCKKDVEATWWMAHKLAPAIRGMR
jgi:hypothetical protein